MPRSRSGCREELHPPIPPKMGLFGLSWRRRVLYQLHQQLLQVKATGSARGALGDRGWSEGASLAWLESAKLPVGITGRGPDGTGMGDFASAGRSGCGGLRVVSRLAQTPLPSDFPGCAGARRGCGHGMEWVVFLLQLPKPVGSGKGLGLVPGRVWGVSRLCWAGRLCLPKSANGSEEWASRLARRAVPTSPRPLLVSQLKNWLWVGSGSF